MSNLTIILILLGISFVAGVVNAFRVNTGPSSSMINLDGVAKILAFCMIFVPGVIITFVVGVILVIAR